jgi:hypothetical protein
VLLRGGSGNAVPGLAKKVLNKEGGVGGGDMWLEALGKTCAYCLSVTS